MAAAALTTYAPTHDKIRLGATNDGGYVIVDGYEYDAFFSCGLGDNVSFDVAFYERYPNVPGFAFDGTVDRPAHLPAPYTFFKQNIGTVNSGNTTNLQPVLEPYNNVFLKMDIEGYEWGWLQTTDLRKFRQIVIEYHGMGDNSWQAYAAVKEQVLKKIADTHYVTHVHGNNNCHMSMVDGVQMPYVLEVTYVRKNDEQTPLSLNTKPFPQAGVDYPNLQSKADMVMDSWPFCAAP